ncbi:MAG: 16S rRNA (cytidine(1402)-2'-O)-methyltransferase [Ignavibacteria bacterium]|jgi:16S rRNA (cytidine1402-2'-O)-methyltransferase|nr:16S rRNA (cytidine(1402)-2'-O)-methyltransferase [Ignavibacteria bacterium]
MEFTGYDNYKEFTERKFPNLKIERGVLYIVSTPVGNLKDISFRALFVLSRVDLIACEDTRVTSVLLNRYGIKNRLTSYYSKVESSKMSLIINELETGNSVALVSDAGTPGISDPGNMLISECIKRKYRVSPVPGASALIHALVMSGFENNHFFFQGFLPQKGREKLYSELKKKRMPVIIYESRFRIKKTLSEMREHFGKRQTVVSRELTKLHETHYRGTLNEILSSVSGITDKGEFVIVINNI